MVFSSEKRLHSSDHDHGSFFDRFVHFMFRPVDGHSLAVFRILFGFLMLIDLNVERAFYKADERWSHSDECRFPLVEWIKPLPGPYMNLLYLVLTFGSIGMLIGYKFKLSITIYALIYWYIFLLDKSYWNNHSYLFGLITNMLAFSDSHKIWSIDGRKSKKNNHDDKVAFWQYFIIRYQISLVYFLAGVKKANLEWIGGYSMRYLSSHWVFSPFRLVLSADLVDLIVVHWGGFIIDSSVGFLLLFQLTRPLGYLFTGLFNSMNSQIFSIGMFPYVMLAVLPIYSSPDWPKGFIKCFNPSTKTPIKVNCLGTEDETKEKAPGDEGKMGKNEGEGGKRRGKNDVQRDTAPTKSKLSHSRRSETQSSATSELRVTSGQRVTCIVLLVYMGLQLGLPFSHSLTQGYNTWTEGVYGYSWDMMVHNWRLLGKRISIVDKQSGKEVYLNVEKYSPNNRWTHHADMAKQFAECLGNRIRKVTNLTDFEIHMDVWMSLNKRFAQRVFDPTVDLLSADWSPFRKPSWVLPMLTQFTSWRSMLKEYEERVLNSNESLYVVFMADFPGFDFVNFVDPQFGDTTIKVLSGWVKLQVEGSFVRLMTKGDESKLPSGKFHSVVPIKSQPASYMYTFTNATAAESIWQLEGNKEEKPEKKDYWIIRYSRKWIRSFQIIFESLVAIGEQVMTTIGSESRFSDSQIKDNF